MFSVFNVQNKQASECRTWQEKQLFDSVSEFVLCQPQMYCKYKKILSVISTYVTLYLSLVPLHLSIEYRSQQGYWVVQWWRNEMLSTILPVDVSIIGVQVKSQDIFTVTIPDFLIFRPIRVFKYSVWTKMLELPKKLSKSSTLEFKASHASTAKNWERFDGWCGGCRNSGGLHCLLPRFNLFFGNFLLLSYQLPWLTVHVLHDSKTSW